MTDLILSQNTPATTMSSREIAELVESRHDNVKVAMERLAERGVIKLPALQEVKNHLGQTVSEYRVCKRDSYIIVAQLSPEFTARLVDRWQELEDAKVKSQLPDFSNPVLAARAWADEVEKRQLIEQEKKALEAQIEADAPKVTLAEEISADERSAITIREAAKILGFKEKDVREKARQLHYIFRNPRGQWEVYADTLRQGLMATKAEYINGLLFSVPCFTPRGLSEVRVGMGYGDLFKRIKRSMVTA